MLTGLWRLDGFFETKLQQLAIQHRWGTNGSMAPSNGIWADMDKLYMVYRYMGYVVSTQAACPSSWLSRIYIPYIDAHGPSYGGVGPSYGGVRGLKSLGFERPRAVWSVWVYRSPGTDDILDQLKVSRHSQFLGSHRVDLKTSFRPPTRSSAPSTTKTTTPEVPGGSLTF